MVFLKDAKTWLVVYFDKNEEDQQSQTSDESVDMNIVPDFWIDKDQMMVYWPPFSRDFQVNNAIFGRIKPAKEWKLYKITKIRFDTESRDYSKAMQHLKICEENSSGADEELAMLENKKLRSARAKKSKYSTDDYVSKAFKTNAKFEDSEEEEDDDSPEIAANEFIAVLPKPPNEVPFSPQVKSKDSIRNVKNTNNRKVLENIVNKLPIKIAQGPSNSASGLKEIGSNVDGGHHNDKCASKRKPRVVNDETGYFLSENVLKNCSENSLKKAKTVVIDHPKIQQDDDQDNQENDVEVANVRQDHRSNSNGDSVMKDIGIVGLLTEKLDLIIANQHQLALNQLKGNVAASSPQNEGKVESWFEEKALIKRYFSEMSEDAMFCDFDEQLGSSKKWRSKIMRYLLEKVDSSSWQNTLRLILNAGMPVKIQKLYSLKGQRGKKKFCNTQLYGILQVIVQGVANKNGKINSKTIDTYFSNYLKSATARVAGGKPQKNGQNIVEKLLFGVPEEASNDADTAKNLEGNNGEDDVEGNQTTADEETEEKQESTKKLEKSLKNQRALMDDIVNKAEANLNEEEIQEELEEVYAM